jgi:hypothetical protein
MNNNRNSLTNPISPLILNLTNSPTEDAAKKN